MAWEVGITKINHKCSMRSQPLKILLMRKFEFTSSIINIISINTKTEQHKEMFKATKIDKIRHCDSWRQMHLSDIYSKNTVLVENFFPKQNYDRQTKRNNSVVSFRIPKCE